MPCLSPTVYPPRRHPNCWEHLVRSCCPLAVKLLPRIHFFSIKFSITIIIKINNDEYVIINLACIISIFIPMKSSNIIFNIFFLMEEVVHEGRRA